MKTTFKTMEEFQSELQSRRASKQALYGEDWTMPPWPSLWSVAHIQDTGEVYAAHQEPESGLVIILGCAPTGTGEEVARVLSGWQKHMGPGGLEWVRERLAQAGWAPQDDEDRAPGPLRRESRIEQLNPEQRLAATTVLGPVLIIAGPGTGKTRTITHRAAHLVLDQGASPGSIICVTFTRKANQEMRERLESMLGQDAVSLQISTFHGLCAIFLRRHGQEIGIPQDYSIYDADDQELLIKQNMAPVGVSIDEFKPSQIRDAISKAKAWLITPEELTKQAAQHAADHPDDARELLQAAALVYPAYQRDLERNDALDFDDMIVKTVRLLQESRSVREGVHRQYRHIMVDEFQDTNLAQYELVRLITGPEQNVCVVGDQDQAIYGWRGASSENINKFQNDYPDAKLVRLNRNYRSTQAILDMAQSLIKHNEERIDNPLTTDNPEGYPIETRNARNEDEEARWSIGVLSGLVRQGEARWQDCAVAYRMNAQSRALEDICMRNNVRYRIVGGTPFYERAEVKNVLAYLRIVHNPKDSISLRRIINTPPRSIGDRTIQKVVQYAEDNQCNLLQAVGGIARSSQATNDDYGLKPRAVKVVTDFHDLIQEFQTASRHMTVSQLVDRILEATGLAKHILNDKDGPERWANIEELKAMTKPYGTAASPDGLSAFLERMSISQDTEDDDPEEGRLTLITLHQAKGLEFAAVAIAGMEEGALPHQRSEDIDEERRLCYVGMTRAKKYLFLSWCRERWFMNREPSRFLFEAGAVTEEEAYQI